jgi:hypothetical protein
MDDVPHQKRGCLMLTIAESARRLSKLAGKTIAPRVLSDAFYNRLLNEDFALLIAGRRVIPENNLPAILAALRRAGKCGGK